MEPEGRSRVRGRRPSTSPHLLAGHHWSGSRAPQEETRSALSGWRGGLSRPLLRPLHGQAQGSAPIDRCGTAPGGPVPPGTSWPLLVGQGTPTGQEPAWGASDHHCSSPGTSFPLGDNGRGPHCSVQSCKVSAAEQRWPLGVQLGRDSASSPQPSPASDTVTPRPSLHTLAATGGEGGVATPPKARERER